MALRNNVTTLMILLLNGAFGIGKTTVARLVVRRLRRGVLFDPELIGMALHRFARLFGRDVDDFQDLRLWRRLTILGLRITRLFTPNIVVPMAISNAGYLEEIRRGLGPDVVHVCLVAPLEIVHERLRNRGGAHEWEFRRASECCDVHRGEAFARQIDAAHRSAEDIADEISGL